jgi:hypothetical protein
MKLLKKCITLSIVLAISSCFNSPTDKKKNEIPLLINEDNKIDSLYVGQTYSDTLRAKDDNLLRFEVLQAPTSLIIQDSIISWKPDTLDTGLIPIRIVAIDSYGGSDTLNLSLFINVYHIPVDSFIGDWVTISQLVKNIKNDSILSNTSLGASMDSSFTTFTESNMLSYNVSNRMTVSNDQYGYSQEYWFTDTVSIPINFIKDSIYLIQPQISNDANPIGFHIALDNDTMILTGVNDTLFFQVKLLRSQYSFPSQTWPPFYTFWNVYGTSCTHPWDTEDILGVWMFDLSGITKDTVYWEVTGNAFDGTIYGYYFTSQDSVINWQDSMIPIDNDLSRKSGAAISLYVSTFLPAAFGSQYGSNKYLIRFQGALLNNTSIQNGTLEYSNDNGNSWSNSNSTFSGIKLCRVDQNYVPKATGLGKSVSLTTKGREKTRPFSEWITGQRHSTQQRHYVRFAHGRFNKG